MINKKIKTLLIVSLSAMLLTACGSGKNDTATENKTENKEEASEQTDSAQTGNETGKISTKDYDVDKYVTIGDYENLSVEVPVYMYTDEDVQKEMQGEVDYFIQSTGAYDYEKTDKDTVENGDTVNIDYVGKKDGVAFDGGTAQGAHLTIGSGQFIDGFESGLEGHKVGEKVSLNLTFPEQYHSQELAGADVVFDVTINAIEQQKTPELTDDLVVQMGRGISTVEEFKKSTEDYLKEQVESRNDSEKKTAVWQAVYETCEVSEPPKEMVDEVLERIRGNLVRYAQQYNVSEDDFIVQYMGSTREEYDAASRESAVNSSKEKLAAAAIAKKEGINLTDDQIKEYAAKDAENYGYQSADEVISQTGAGAYYDYVLGQKVDELLIQKIKVNEKTPVSIMSTLEEGNE